MKKKTTTTNPQEKWNNSLADLIHCNLHRIEQYRALIAHVDQQHAPGLQASLESAMQASQRFKTQLQQLAVPDHPSPAVAHLAAKTLEQSGLEIAVIPQALETESMLIKSYQEALQHCPNDEQLQLLLKGHLKGILETVERLQDYPGTP